MTWHTLRIFERFPAIMEACGGDPARIPPAVFRLYGAYCAGETR